MRVTANGISPPFEDGHSLRLSIKKRRRLTLIYYIFFNSQYINITWKKLLVDLTYSFRPVVSSVWAIIHVSLWDCNYLCETSFIPLFLYSFIHLFIYSFIHLSIYSFIHLFIYSFIHLFIYSFIHLFIYSFIHFFYSFIRLFIYSFLHLFIYSYILLFIYSYTNTFVHSYIYCLTSILIALMDNRVLTAVWLSFMEAM